MGKIKIEREKRMDGRNGLKDDERKMEKQKGRHEGERVHWRPPTKRGLPR